MTEEGWLTRTEVCKRFGVCDDTILFWIKNKNFPAVKDGFFWKFKWSEIDAWCRTVNAVGTRAYKGDDAPVKRAPQPIRTEAATRPAVSYKPLFKLLVDLNMKKKDLAEEAEISMATITKMGRVGSHVNTDVLERICLALNCKIGDIVEIVQVSDKELLIDDADTEDEELVSLDPAACEEFGLTQTEQEIVRFVYEQLQYYRDNPPSYMVNQVRTEIGLSLEESKRSIPSDRFYSLVLNEVIERWGQAGCSLAKKGVPFSLIESGYFQAEEETFGEMTMI